MKRRRCDEAPTEPDAAADRISNLPVDAMERILCFLPVKDAARTALLSSQWRYGWRSLPQLVFDANFNEEEGDYYNSSESSEFSESSELINQIYQALLVHDGPITKFVLSIPQLTPCKEINHMILHLSRKGVQELSLEFHNYNCGNFKGRFGRTTWLVGFNQLTRLNLRDVALPLGFCNNILPKCPLLEDLRLSRCLLVDDVQEFTAPRLQVLHLESQFGEVCFKCTPLLSVLSVLEAEKLNYSHVNHVPRVDMASMFAPLPALKHLDIGLEFIHNLAAGKHVPACLPSPLHNLQSLRIRHILLDSLSEARVLVCLIMSSPNLRDLTIEPDQQSGHRFDRVTPSLEMLQVQAEDRPDGYSGYLQCLEVFHLKNSLHSQLEMELLQFVLDNAPKLRKVDMENSVGKSYRNVSKFLNMATPCSGYLECLRVFHIRNIRDSKIELELLQYVLANAPNLQKVVMENSERSLDYKDASYFLKALATCKRASKEAEVIYYWNDEANNSKLYLSAAVN